LEQLYNWKLLGDTHSANQIIIIIAIKKPDFIQQLTCLHDQNKSGFLEGRLFSSQSELYEYFLNCSDWLGKSQPSKKATFVLIM